MKLEEVRGTQRIRRGLNLRQKINVDEEESDPLIAC